MREIAFLMLEQAQRLDFAGPHDVLTVANQVLEYQGARRSSLYQIKVVSDRQFVTIAGKQGLQLTPAARLQSFNDKVDTVVVVGSQTLVSSFPPKVIAWLRSISSRSRRTVSICTGAFLLAAAGLLDGRRAATHWMFCHELSKRYPAVRVDESAIYVKDGSFYSSAGVCSGIDLMLALVEEDHGSKVAHAVARGLVVYLRRPGNQTQFSQMLTDQFSDAGPFSELVPWMTNNLRRNLKVEILAQRCSMSERNFARQFKSIFATTPARYVAKLRLEAAKVLLTDTDLSIDQIALRCGFSNSDVFRNSFLRDLDTNPNQYRRLWLTKRGSLSKPGRPQPDRN